MNAITSSASSDGTSVAQFPRLSGDALALGLGCAGLLFGGHGALALEVAVGVGLAQFVLGALLQPGGGGGLALRGGQGQTRLGASRRAVSARQSAVSARSKAWRLSCSARSRALTASASSARRASAWRIGLRDFSGGGEASRQRCRDPQQRAADRAVQGYLSVRAHGIPVTHDVEVGYSVARSNRDSVPAGWNSTIPHFDQVTQPVVSRVMQNRMAP
jgi:hypothetical protein